MAGWSPAGARPVHYLRWIFVTLFIAWGTTWLDRMAFLYLSPYIAGELKLTAGQIGQIAAMTGLTWGLAAIGFGAVSDRYGRRVVLIPGTLAMGVLSAATALTHTLPALLAVRGLLGFAEGAIASTLFTVLGEESPAIRRGWYIGLVLSASPLIGNFVGPVLMTQTANRFGWSTGFVVAALPAFVMGLILLVFMREPKRSAAASLVHTAVDGASDVRTIPINVALILMQGTLFVMALISFITFAPLYLTKIDHFTPAQMGFILSAAGIGTFLSAFSIPLLSDYIGRKWGLCLACVLWCFVPLSVIYGGANAILLAVVGFVGTTTQAVAALVLSVIPVESVNPKRVATIVGLAMFLGEFFGGTIAPIVGGHFADVYGLDVPIWIAFGATALMLVLSLFIQETAPRRRAASGAAPLGNTAPRTLVNTLR